jgi:hypothetical protein
MNYQRLLALYHFCNLYHSGRSSRLYALGCKVSKHFTPTRAEEYPEVLSRPGYETALKIYLRLVKGEIKYDCSGIHNCNQCGYPTMSSKAESAIVVCDDCLSGDYEP